MRSSVSSREGHRHRLYRVTVTRENHVAVAQIGGMRRDCRNWPTPVPHELAVPGIDYYFFFGGLYPAYARGLAYLAAHHGTEAAAEFQKMLDHPGIVLSDPMGALAHLGVARANALQAKNSQGADADAARLRARAAYEDFLTLWKDADPDVPILKQAKAEYAKLQ